MLENILNTAANFMNKVSKWLTFPSIPFDKFSGMWNELVDKIAPWNKIFPITDLIIIVGLCVGLASALIIFYTVVLIKSFIPMSGGK